jgi:nucleoside-triphosphatase THEP1
MTSTPKRILLTGPRGAGKTTACLALRALAAHAGLPCGGVLTLPLDGGAGARAGLDLLDVRSGERRLLASCRRDLGGPRIGPYSMAQATFDWGVALDEVGPLELDRGGGFAPLLPELARAASAALVVVVRPALLDRLRGAPGLRDSPVQEITLERRAEAPARIFRLLFPDGPFPPPADLG